jgi:hypothetical protein
MLTQVLKQSLMGGFRKSTMLVTSSTGSSVGL